MIYAKQQHTRNMREKLMESPGHHQLPNDTLCLKRRPSTMKLITERQNEVHVNFPASKKARNSPQKNKKLNV